MTSVVVGGGAIVLAVCVFAVCAEGYQSRLHDRFRDPIEANKAIAVACIAAAQTGLQFLQFV